MRIALILLLCLPCAALPAQEDGKKVSQQTFTNLVEQSGLTFNMPSGYTPTLVKQNPDLAYDFAMINADSSMEVRYTIWPLAPALKQYEESLKDSNSLMIPPNNIYRGRIQANMLNMTGGKMYPIGGFPPEAVKEEFHADAGGSCFFEFNCKFGKGWQYGQFVYLHQDNVADVIITFMSNDVKKHPDLMLIPFHALVFQFNQ